MKLCRERLAGGVSWLPWAYTGSYHAFVTDMQAAVAVLTWQEKCGEVRIEFCWAG